MLELHNIQKSFDDTPVLRSISLVIPDGQIVALLGPSGSGKTTLLRIIAGLEQADAGQVLLNGRDLTAIPVHSRHFGMVFQDYALFPHKTVIENVAFGLRMQKWPQAEQEERVAEMLSLVGLAGFGERRVYELSGGEQQRVALARALAPAPRLLLLDEPLGALDRALRERLTDELRTILTAAGTGEDPVTSIYVTHDQSEAFTIADRVVVMKDGGIEQDAQPVVLYRQPRTAFVARFIGMDNLFEATLVSRQPALVDSVLGTLAVSTIPDTVEDASRFILLIRPEAGRILRKGGVAENRITGLVKDLSFRGRYQEMTLALAQGVTLELAFEADQSLPEVGNEVDLALAPSALTLLQIPESGRS